MASASPRRLEILSMAGIPCEVIPSDIDENAFPLSCPSALVKELSLLKARNVASRVEDAIIIGADTVVYLNDEIIGKPKDKDDAFSILKKLLGNKHTVYTGVTVINLRHDTEYTFVQSADVFMLPATDKEIYAYIETGEPMDKAGAYAVQGRGCIFIERIDGDFYTVMGMPIAKLYSYYRRANPSFMLPIR